MNIKLYKHYGADDLWLEYSEWDGEIEIDSIYIGSDPKRTNLCDYLSDSVMSHALEQAKQDWLESAIDRAEYILEDR